MSASSFPHLSAPAPPAAPRVLIGLVQNKNRHLQGQLVRDTFDEQLKTMRNAHRVQLRAVDNAARARARMPFQMKTYRTFFKTLSKASNPGSQIPTDPPPTVTAPLATP